MVRHTGYLVILAGWFVTTIAYPVIYHGLLSIGVMISNPLGTELIELIAVLSLPARQ